MDAGTDESRFSFTNVNTMEVHRAINHIKSNAVGLDGISLKFLKLILPIIQPCVLNIFNTVLTNSIFPAEGKILLSMILHREVATAGTICMRMMFSSI
jgi:hypothetical protein